MSNMSDGHESVDGFKVSSAADMLEHERSVLFGNSGGEKEASALCLSGGGIRSATFSLGVLQALAKHGKLDGFHYLSTVSGGGYIGSWLSRWRQARGNDFSWDDLAATSSKHGESAAQLNKAVGRLRAFSNFMSPKWGLSLDNLTVFTIFLRNLVLNLLVWIPVVLAAATLPRLIIALGNYFGADWQGPAGLAVLSPGLWIVGLSLALSLLIILFVIDLNENGREWISKAAAAIVGLSLSWIFLLGICAVVPDQLEVEYKAALKQAKDAKNEEVRTGTVADGAEVRAATAESALLKQGSNGPPTQTDEGSSQPSASAKVPGSADNNAALPKTNDPIQNARMAREAATTARRNANAAKISWFDALLLSLSDKDDELGPLISPETLGASGGLLALLVSLYGFWSKNGPDIRRRSQGLFRKFGTKLFNVFAGLLVLTAFVASAFAARELIKLASYVVPPAVPADVAATSIAFVGLLFIALFMSFFVGANRFSLHSVYGNRLGRAYLGPAREKDRSPNWFTDFDAEDDLPMQKLLASQRVDGKPNLFHVLNMTLNLSGSSHREWQERKAASFTATPLHGGSDAIGKSGYTDIKDYGSALSLGKAMTISGAAASPNMGYHSAPFVTMIMTFFNARLGWWLASPKNISEKAKLRREAKEENEDSLPESEQTSDVTQDSEPPLQLNYLLKEALSLTKEDTGWLYLSDGGHFENLGVYEMIRRHCRRIVVVDAGCDGDFEHSDLHNAVRKAHVDFGIRIELPPTLPGQNGPGKNQRIVVGKIHYSELDRRLQDGEIIIVKPVLTGNEPPSLPHYAKKSRSGMNTFPHHSTLDQFYNETQFESYRLLGEVSGEDLVLAFSELDARKPRRKTKAKSNGQSSEDEIVAAYPLFENREALISEIKSGQAREDHLIPIEATPPPPRIAGLDSLKDAIEAMSSFKLAASSVAAAGIIGASFQVGGEVGLNVADTIGLDVDSIQLKAPTEPLPVGSARVEGITDAGEKIESMRASLEEIAKAAVAKQSDQVDVSELQTAVNNLEEKLNTAAGRFEDIGPGTGTVAATISQDELEPITRNLGQLNASLEAIEDNVTASTRYDDAIVDQLRRIERRLSVINQDMNSGG